MVTRALEVEAYQIIPWVFHDKKERRIRSCRSEWERAREKGGKACGPLAHGDLADRLVPDLRRTAARNIERASVPRSVAMRLMGHKTETVYRRYAIFAKSDLEECVAKLAKLHGDRVTSSAQMPPKGQMCATGVCSPLVATREQCCNTNINKLLGQLDPVAQLEEQLTFNQ